MLRTILKLNLLLARLMLMHHMEECQYQPAAADVGKEDEERFRQYLQTGKEVPRRWTSPAQASPPSTQAWLSSTETGTGAGLQHENQTHTSSQAQLWAAREAIEAVKPNIWFNFVQEVQRVAVHARREDPAHKLVMEAKAFDQDDR